MDPAGERLLGASAVRVTRLGLGCAALGNLYAAVTDEDARATVRAAWDCGVRFFDTAPLYGFGLSERRVGDVLRAEPRRDFALSSKVGRLLRPAAVPPPDAFVDPLPFAPQFDYTYDGVLRSFEDSRQRLGLERIDVLLVHDVGARTHGADAHPGLLKELLDGGWRALSELREADVIGAAGLGVNEAEVCLEVLAHADPDCFLLAGRYTLLEQAPLDELLPRCVDRRVSLIVGGPYNSGLLASAGVADGRTYDYARAPRAVVERAQAIERVCRDHGAALPAAALQFPLLHPAVASVIPGARSADEVRENAAHLRAPLPAALWRDLVAAGLLHPGAPTAPPPEDA